MISNTTKTGKNLIYITKHYYERNARPKNVKLDLLAQKMSN